MQIRELCVLGPAVCFLSEILNQSEFIDAVGPKNAVLNCLGCPANSRDQLTVCRMLRIRRLACH